MIILAILILCVSLNADTMLDIKSILKPNEALVIDGRTNKINFVLEITKDGKIKKRFLNESEKAAIYKQLDANKLLDSTQINPTQKIDKYPNSHIKEWDKTKIIYEQIVDKIDILR